MADNSKTKRQPAQNAMMAEIIITELEKFKASHDAISRSAEKILNQYGEVKSLITLINKRDEALSEILRTIQLTQEQYVKLTEMTMTVANELKTIKKQGIDLNPDAIENIIHAVNKTNKPIRIHIILLTYGVIAAFSILLYSIFTSTYS